MSLAKLTIPSAESRLPTIAAAPGSLALEVLSGVHSGVRTPIEGASCAIGSSWNCDVVLADKDVAPDHLRLRFYGKLVAIDAIGGDVAIEGRQSLVRGYGCRVNLPVTLSVGEARLRIARDRAEGQAMRRWATYAVGILAVVAAPVLALQAGLFEFMPRQAMAHAEPSREYVASIPAQPFPGMPASASLAASDSDVANGLKERIETAGLDTLTLSADGRRIEVSGEIPAARMTDWGEIQRWFDRTHGGRYILTSLVSTAAVANAPSFTFQAVWFGKNPYIIDARGERRYPGAPLQDGWMLKAIEPGGILVVRDGEEFKLTL